MFTAQQASHNRSIAHRASIFMPIDRKVSEWPEWRAAYQRVVDIGIAILADCPREPGAAQVAWIRENGGLMKTAQRAIVAVALEQGGDKRGEHIRRNLMKPHVVMNVRNSICIQGFQTHEATP